ncbi:radical SAM protein [Nitrosomonadales bacterium]|jgi:wyosine [tRNA(Phe)-imidazoG37] synthetase (radical SAM superfamily)|nr:radical SAM protein [Nitrosomonadales bacterium]
MPIDILTITKHDRNIFQGKYIYPVVSRRAGGLSLGINLNTNSACNWQCIYCEVPNLVRGKPEAINLQELESELDYWLDQITNKSFLNQYTKIQTEFKDIAFSGNGEPTASKQFMDVVSILIKKVAEYKLDQKIIIRLITNGSYMSNLVIQESLSLIRNINREIWFKIDSVNKDDIRTVNQVNLSLVSIKKNLEAALNNSPTVIQTCLFKLNEKLPSSESLGEYINFLKPYENKIKGIHLYSLARLSEQPSQNKLTRLTESELEVIAIKMKVLNIPIQIFS